MIFKNIFKIDILIDTHILLWHLSDNPKLSKEKSEMIENVDNRIFFSIASLWEIAIEKSIGKLEVMLTIDALIPNEISILDIMTAHIEKVIDLPFFHRDQFDRMIIAQAITENLTIMTDDEYFKQYKVNII